MASMASQDFQRKIQRQSILTRNRMAVEAVKRGKEISPGGELIASLKRETKVIKKQGIPFRVRFGFLVRGSYIYAGVGRGTTIAQAMANQSKRDKVDWYKAVILQEYDKFGDLWQQYWAERMMEELENDLDNLEK